MLEPINLGSSELVSINQLVDIVEEIAGIKLKRKYNLTAPKGVNGRNSDNTLIKKLLGWEPNTRLRDGHGKDVPLDLRSDQNGRRVTIRALTVVHAWTRSGAEVDVSRSAAKTFLVFSQTFVPDPASVGQHMADVCIEMARRGHRVRVYTRAARVRKSRPNYPRARNLPRAWISGGFRSRRSARRIC